MDKKILFVIDEIEFKYFELNKLVTNFWLIWEFLKRGFDVKITTKKHLYLLENNAYTLCFDTKILNDNIIYKKEEIHSKINDFSIVFFRPDPPVDIDYINACYIFDFVDCKKTFVINNPCEVKNFNEKFHANFFPEFLPKNIVTSSKELIKEFVKKEGDCVLKPLNRCFGSGVFYLKADDKNINSIILNATNNETTLVMVQKKINSKVNGDKRVLIIGEKVFDECVMKLAGKDDFKFNTHSDQFFAPSSLSKQEREMAQKIAKTLSTKGLYMVGLDVMEGKILEINVTSPCYFIKEINSFYNSNFENKIMDTLLNIIEIHFATQNDKILIG